MNETRKRSIAKSIVWRIICVIVSVVISYLVTANLDIAVVIGTSYNIVTMILYYFHERIWNKVTWGKRG